MVRLMHARGMGGGSSWWWTVTVYRIIVRWGGDWGLFKQRSPQQQQILPPPSPPIKTGSHHPSHDAPTQSSNHTLHTHHQRLFLLNSPLIINAFPPLLPSGIGCWRGTLLCYAHCGKWGRIMVVFRSLDFVMGIWGAWFIAWGGGVLSPLGGVLFGRVGGNKGGGTGWGGGEG